jgi:hypothetical protein
MTERTCEQCGNSFTPKAPHQRFDTPECRYQHCIEKSAQEANQRVEEGVRRPTRDGNGTKVYLTLSEVIDLQQGRRSRRTDEKLVRATKRILGPTR